MSISQYSPDGKFESGSFMNGMWSGPQGTDPRGGLFNQPSNPSNPQNYQGFNQTLGQPNAPQVGQGLMGLGQQPQQGQPYSGFNPRDSMGMPPQSFGDPSLFMNQGAMPQNRSSFGDEISNETSFIPPQGYNQLGEFIGQRPNPATQEVPNYEMPMSDNKNIFVQNDIPMNYQQPQAMQAMQSMQGQPVNTQTVQPNFMGQTPFGQPQTGQFTSTNPFVQAAQANAQGNIAGALQATAANRINQQTPYGSLQYQQTGTDAQGNPIWSANQQLSPELQQLTQSSLAGLQASQANPMYGINPGDTYSNAIMQRLQPQQRQQVEALDAQLANQGIMPGSEAYNRAKTLQGQTQNDALTSAIVGGMNTGIQAQNLQNTTAANIRNLATPGYVNPYNQAAVAGPDYLSAYTAQNATDIARQNAEAAQRSSLLGGLAGLGSSAILGGTGANSALGGLLGLGASGANALSNSSLWSQLFNSGGVPSSDIFSNGNLVDSSGNVLLNSGILESGIM